MRCYGHALACAASARHSGGTELHPPAALPWRMQLISRFLARQHICRITLPVLLWFTVLLALGRNPLRMLRIISLTGATHAGFSQASPSASSHRRLSSLSGRSLFALHAAASKPSGGRDDAGVCSVASPALCCPGLLQWRVSLMQRS